MPVFLDVQTDELPARQGGLGELATIRCFLPSGPVKYQPRCFRAADEAQETSPDVLTEIPPPAGAFYCSDLRVGVVAVRWLCVRAWWSRSR